MKGFLACSILVLLLAPLLAGHPWPRAGGDWFNTSCSPYMGPEDNRVRWRFEVGGYISSSPAIAKDGTIYVTSGDLIVALRDNKLKWRKSFGGKLYFTPSLGEDGTIYIGSDDNKVYALNPDGSLKWSFTAGGMVSSCVVVGRNGKLYFGCADNHTYILSSDGRLERKLPIGGMLLGAAVDNDGTLYFGVLVSSENGIERGRILYALSPEGEVKWSVELPAPLPPVLAADGTIYVGTLEGLLYAYRRDGSPRWREPVKLGQEMYSPPALAQDGTIYACCDNANLSWLVALTSAGEKKWQLPVGSFCRSTPLIDGRGTVYIGGDNLMAIGSDGVIKWQVSVGTKWASAAIAGDGSVCAGTSGYLYVIGRGKEWMNILYVVVVAAVIALALVFAFRKLRG